MYSVLQCTLYIVQVSIKATGQTSSAQILFCVFQIQILSMQLSSPPEQQLLCQMELHTITSFLVH